MPLQSQEEENTMLSENESHEIKRKHTNGNISEHQQSQINCGLSRSSSNGSKKTAAAAAPKFPKIAKENVDKYHNSTKDRTP